MGQGRVAKCKTANRGNVPIGAKPPPTRFIQNCPSWAERHKMGNIPFGIIKSTLDELEYNKTYYQQKCQLLTMEGSLSILAKEIKKTLDMRAGGSVPVGKIKRVLVEHWYYVSEIAPRHAKALEYLGEKRGHTRDVILHHARYGDYFTEMQGHLAKHDERVSQKP